ncbi:MAG: hypothetical protein Kow0090_03180 [Myxococcota bacterium]
MQEWILRKLFLFSEKRGELIIAVIVALTLAFSVFIPGLRISSSHLDLVPPEHPIQAKYLNFMKEFGAADNLVVVLEGEPETLKASADYFAAEFHKEKNWVRSVFYKIDIAALAKRASLYIPVDILKQGLEVVSKQTSIIEGVSRLNSLATILEYIRLGFNSEESELEISPEVAPYALEGISLLFDEWLLWIDDPAHNKIEVLNKLFLTGIEAESIIKSEGYLLSYDGRMLFIFVQPTSPDDDISYLRPFMNTIKGACERVFAKYPKLRGNIKVAFTGMPAHMLTESETVFADVGKAGAISAVLVAFILLIGFGSIRKMLLGIIPLLCGMIITLGVSRLLIGHLNLISSSFMAVLFGIGIDFGVYLIRRAEEELGNGVDKREAIYVSVVNTGGGIITGGVTTAMAFLAITFSDFVGFAELGLTAGLGILIVLTTTFLMLPTLLLRIKIEPRTYNVNWLITTSVKRWHRPVLYATALIAFLLTAYSIHVTPKIPFDYNALHLLPKDSESTIYQIRMQEQSDLQMSFAAVTTNTLAELKRLVRKLKTLPTVSRIDSLAEMIPDEQPQKLEVIRQYKQYLGGVRIKLAENGDGAERLTEVLGDLEGLLEEAQEKAFSGGRADIVDIIEKILRKIELIKGRLTGDDGQRTLRRTKEFERNIFYYAEQIVSLLHNWLDATPITEGFFSPELLARFKSPKGRYVAYVFPKGSIWDVDFLDNFVEQVEGVAPDVTGFPVTHRVYSRLVVKGFTQAMLLAFFIILLILALDFKRSNAVILSLIPLVTGLLWMQTVMHLMGESHNYANIAGFPLLLGLGVVYGVHIVHRWLENPKVTAFAAAATTGRGVSFAALTTIAGLLSIVFARHRGVSTFGFTLLLGISLCLLSALYILPSIIDLIYLKSRNGENNGNQNKSK